MPPVHSRRSGIPRLAGGKNVDTRSGPVRKPRNSSSSDPEGEYSTTAEGARAKVSKPLKMQGPFRPSIVGRMVKGSDWECSKRGKAKSKDSQPVVARKGSSEDDQWHGSKSKSRSPPNNRPVLVDSKQDARHSNKAPERSKINKNSQSQSPECSKTYLEIKKENEDLRKRLDSVSDELSTCKGALEKCHIDPVTLETIGLDDEVISHEKSITLAEVKETKTSLENILEQNTELMDGLRDLLKGLS